MTSERAEDDEQGNSDERAARSARTGHPERGIVRERTEFIKRRTEAWGTMSTPKEAVICGAIVRYINDLPRARARKVHGGPYGKSGEPDIDACINGRAVKIEVKRAGRVMHFTPLQALRLAEWRDAGAITLIATSVEEVREALRAEGMLVP